MAVKGRLIFDNQAILTIGPLGPVTNLKNEPGRLPFQERRIQFLQVPQERRLNVIGLADIDPLAGIRDSIDTRESRRMLPDR
jgi:hypothetical protein